jgi:hypothetical protein
LFNEIEALPDRNDLTRLGRGRLSSSTEIILSEEDTISLLVRGFEMRATIDDVVSGIPHRDEP